MKVVFSPCWFFLYSIAHESLCLLQADRPIASIAFHAHGEILAVASGHKVKEVHSL